MRERRLSAEIIQSYESHLRQEEKAAGTSEKYLRDVKRFGAWLDGRTVTKEAAAGWREHLAAQGYSPATVNSMLAALNCLFRFLAWEECRVKFLKIQRRMFREPDRELTRSEYDCLLAAAQDAGLERLALLMETICATGVRVSEVKYFTVESARRGRAEIRLKGKIRTILLPNKLCRKLLKYAKKQKNRLRRDFSHQKRNQPEPPANLGRAEAAVPAGRGFPQQGISSQPAAPVCHHIL